MKDLPIWGFVAPGGINLIFIPALDIDGDERIAIKIIKQTS